MDNEKLLKRIQELEVEVQRLKMQVAPGASQTARVVKKSVTFVLSYWTLLSFLVAIGVAIFIKVKFDVDYFENYRAVSESRKISGFHQKLGEQLLVRQEWEAAEDAFTKAIDADKNNTDASYGLVKSRIFKPQPGEKFASAETQDTMIAFLREHRPDDPDLDLLQAWRHWSQSDAAATKAAALSALKRNPRYAAAQMLLSHVALVEGDVQAAADWCRKGLETIPEDPGALSNMGWFLLLLGNPGEAIPMLQRSSARSGAAVTSLILADCHRLTGSFEAARNSSRHAMKVLTNADYNTGRLAGGEWYYNYLAENANDTESRKSGIFATSLSRKQALAWFSLGLDSALTGDAEEAQKAFSSMREAEPGTALDAYYLNKIKACLYYCKLTADDPKVKLLMLLLFPEPETEGSE
jgi:tetratricopeptide (TPR) repeat protein